MFSTVLKEVTGHLERRFVLVLLFPSLLFWGGLMAVYNWQTGIENSLSAWLEQEAGFQAIQIIGGIAWIVFFASMLESRLVWLTRLYEGYWEGKLLGVGTFFSNLRKKHYHKVIESEDRQAIYYAYPPSKYSQAYLKYVMPTQLGNVLRNAELYPYERYKIDAVLLWPRLLAVIPESFAKSLDSAKSSLDFMLVISFLSGAFAFISGVYLLATGSPWVLFLSCFLGGLVASRLAYRTALDAAISYGQLIKSAFDVFKGDLVEKMGYEQPKSLEDEKKFWENLSQLVYRNFPQDPGALQYNGSAEEADNNAQEAYSISRIWTWITHLIQKIGAWFTQQ